MHPKATVQQLIHEHDLHKKLAESASHGVWNGVSNV